MEGLGEGKVEEKREEGEEVETEIKNFKKNKKLTIIDTLFPITKNNFCLFACFSF